MKSAVSLAALATLFTQLACGSEATLDAETQRATMDSSAGTLFFNEDFSENHFGALRQGSTLDVHYDLDRLPVCRGTHNGYPAWDLIGTARFLPGGEVVEGSVRAIVSDNGRPTNEAVEQLWSMPIPTGATSVELWFKNFTGAGSSCVTWDSNFGDNYRFDIWPAEDSPRCQNVEKETGVRSEADTMVHMAPHCLGYDLDVQYDATFCELFVEGFGDGYVGHYGIPVEWLVGYLRVGAQDGELLGVGMFTRYHAREGGAGGERFSFGEQLEPGLWKVGFAYHVTGFQSVAPVDVIADEVAFFLDVRRPSGKVVRLWQSQRGANYRVSDVFAPGVTPQGIPYGNMEWARDDSLVYASRDACR